MTRKRTRSPEAGPAGALSKPAAQPRLRRLKWNELVRAGDFVAVLPRGFEPWEGPTGFRADAFVRSIYRRDNDRMKDAKPGRQVRA